MQSKSFVVSASNFGKNDFSLLHLLVGQRLHQIILLSAVEQTPVWDTKQEDF